MLKPLNHCRDVLERIFFVNFSLSTIVFSKKNYFLSLREGNKFTQTIRMSTENTGRK